MITWNNLDKLTSYQELKKTESAILRYKALVGKSQPLSELHHFGAG